ncbi:MAG: sugar ABC transporter ATP-binding protein [Verrucomicrobiota bacterium]|nr:sugar ABC transporter ATP-binding protein [Verrucomicrobiota bacterium]
MPVARLRLHAVTKRFGATHALRGVSLTLAPGEVHAIIGENGAGKSTLMKILSGAHQPDYGQMFLNEVPFAPRNPIEGRRAGVVMIYQELNLVPHLTVADNILLGSEPSRFGFLDKKQQHTIARQALAELGHENIPLDAPVSSCSIAGQQMIEIARALVHHPQVLIMDEPTSSLTQADVEKLFIAIDRLKAKGVGILYISHFLEECQRIASHYTVLRDGESVATGKMSEVTLPEILHAMVGRELNEIYPRIPHALGETILEISNLTGITKPVDVSFRLRKGEIMGIAGLIGAGRTETLRAIFGLDRCSGVIEVKNHHRGRTPRARLKQGIGFLSENRKEEGLMLQQTIADNLTLSRLAPFSSFGLLRAGQQHARASEMISRFSIKARDSRQEVGALSGGNQQKVAFARLLHHSADIFLLDEPTRGIDVGSKAEIYSLMGELAAAGKSILFSSSYIPELLGVCDTIAVICRGRLGPAKPVSDWTEHSIIAAAVGQEDRCLS